MIDENDLVLLLTKAIAFGYDKGLLNIQSEKKQYSAYVAATDNLMEFLQENTTEVIDLINNLKSSASPPTDENLKEHIADKHSQIFAKVSGQKY